MSHPEETGRQIGQALAKEVRRERNERLTSPLLKLALQAAPSQVVEVEQWAKASTGKYRILRILNAVRKRLEAEHVPQVRINDLLTDVGFQLVERTFGIDNFRDNALWQKRAKEAIASVGGEVTQHLDALAMDVMFASWFGIQEYTAKPAYFEEAVSKLPAAIEELPLDKDHTFDVADYAEIRLDLKTAAFLKANDASPEIFLGSREELESYYRAKGYELSSELGDSNGSRFLLLRHGDTRKVVVHGVDSEARLTQIGALMRAAGVNTQNVTVRGELARLRDINRNLLELQLAQLNLPIAGVVIGNKNESVEAIANLAGVAPRDLKVQESQVAGPFRFEVVQVLPQGSDKPQAILAFAPAYGELSADLVEATVRMGARNFMIGGAGGSLLPDDEIGTLHQVTQSQVGDALIDLEALAPKAPGAPGITLLELDGAPKVRNIFSPTPLEQDQAWADRVRKAGAENVDQETGPVFAALAKAAAEESIVVQTGLHQSDVVGKGGLAAGTVDQKYGENVRGLASSFAQALGLRAVVTQGGPVELKDAAPGLLAARAQDGIDLSKIHVPVPDPNTIGDSKALSTAQQLKGQKRVLEVVAKDLGSDERAVLRSLLRELPASRYWLTVKQTDPHHGEVLAMARELGFETVAVASKQAVREERLDGQPTFVLKEDDDRAVEKAFDELVRDGKNDEYETNTARHYRCHLGEFDETVDRPGFIYASELDPDLDEVDELAEQMRAELKVAERSLRKGLKQTFGAQGKEAPKMWQTEELGELFRGRTPLLISGASKKSWEEVSPAQQQNVQRTLEKLFETIDPSKYVIVTGGTDFGVEKIAHELAAKRGFDLLGTLTENTEADEVSLNLGHVTFSGINWFGKSRPVLKDIVLEHNGIDLTIGGGKILEEEALLALKLGARINLMDGPEGASTDLAKRHSAHAFKDFDELALRLGVSPR